jgi:hypothetical protein
MKRRYGDPSNSSSTDDEDVRPVSTSSDLPSPKKGKRPKQIQAFVDSWLTEDKFKGLLN